MDRTPRSWCKSLLAKQQGLALEILSPINVSRAGPGLGRARGVGPTKEIASRRTGATWKGCMSWRGSLRRGWCSGLAVWDVAGDST